MVSHHLVHYADPRSQHNASGELLVTYEPSMNAYLSLGKRLIHLVCLKAQR